MALWGGLQNLTGQLNALVEEVVAVDGDIYEKNSDDDQLTNSYYESQEPPSFLTLFGNSSKSTKTNVQTQNN